ncbi:MAG: hypothetical protein AAFU64_11030, partial [Bacteroidota bacterium]
KGLNSPLHPGGEIGLNLREVQKEKSIRRVNVYLGGYYNQEIEIGFYLRGEYQYLYKLTPWLGLDGSIGMGYLHTFFPSDLYEQNEDGSFRKINQGGRPHLLINLGIGLNYLNKSRFQPFIRQDLGLETPFANTVPIVPKSFVKIGTFIQINQPKQND